MTRSVAHIQPAVLRWARESAGYDLDQAARKVAVPRRKLLSAEEGETLLTLRQAERAAHVFRRPLAALFLPAPPVEASVEHQFRRLPGAPRCRGHPRCGSLPVPSPSARPPRGTSSTRSSDQLPGSQRTSPFTAAPDDFAKRVRAHLGVSLDEQRGWRDRTGFQPLRAWRDAVEELGVLVMQDGPAGASALLGAKVDGFGKLRASIGDPLGARD